MNSCESSICFSNFFANKQNVRSFSNIFQIKILNSEYRDQFLHSVLKDDYLVSKLPPVMIESMMELRNNIRINCEKDFKNVFSTQLSSNDGLKTVAKKEICTVSTLYLLKNIMPKAILGNNHNIKIFKSCVKRIIYSMRKQHVIFRNFISTWDFNTLIWKGLDPSEFKNALEKILVWVFQNILSAILCLNFYVTTCKIDADENKLHYFWANEWQRFFDKQIKLMKFNNVLARHEPYCLGKIVKRKYIIEQRVNTKSICKGIPKLDLVLKPNHDFRPIVRYKNGSLTSAEKYKIKEKLTFLKILNGKLTERIDSQFAALHSIWLQKNKPTLYFVKTDLSNAFGSINRTMLMKVLSEKFSVFWESEYPHYIKKKFVLLYKEIVDELNKPLLVRAGSTIYEWKSGLVQGYKYSPALSELYYSYMDEIIFKEHLRKRENDVKLFVRVVDDYLYVTDNKEDALAFLQALSKYKNVNYSKTAANFGYSNITQCNEISFLGYTYDTRTLNVNRAANIYTGQMCYKITFSSAIENTKKFLENRIGRSGITINSHLFNFAFNDEEEVWRIIFITFCLSANKFCTILSILCDEKELIEYLPLYKKKVTVKMANAIIEVLLKNKYHHFMYCINHFRYLSYKALSLCARKTPKCNILVPLIDVELSRTNCIFGKWREHASRINCSGQVLQPAVKIVCRRTDLRKIMKKFDNLPQGFECYKNIFV